MQLASQVIWLETCTPWLFVCRRKCSNRGFRALFLRCASRKCKREDNLARSWERIYKPEYCIDRVRAQIHRNTKPRKKSRFPKIEAAFAQTITERGRFEITSD